MRTPASSASRPWSVYRALRPIAFRLAPEQAHGLAMTALERASRIGALRAGLSLLAPPADPRLETTLFGRTFPNPVGLAAGMDKDGAALPAWAAMGFGHTEIGTVTASAQPGNPRPRVFRLPADRAIVNRMGFPSAGAAHVASLLASWRRAGAWPAAPVGVNLGKSRTVSLEDAAEDYLASLRHLRAFADYLALNVSSPNTPQLRALQDPEPLERLVRALVQAAEGVPVLVKLSPDLSDAALREATGLAEAAGAAGLIVVNTTVARAGLRWDPREAGGLSGRPLAPRARSALRVVRSETALPVISVGGIDDPAEAVRRFEAGADLIQLYTGLVYEGPGLVARIVRELAATLDARGLGTLAELRGTADRRARVGESASPRASEPR